MNKIKIKNDEIQFVDIDDTVELSFKEKKVYSKEKNFEHILIGQRF